MTALPLARATDNDAVAMLAPVGLAAFVAMSHLEAAIGALAVRPGLGVALILVALVTGGWAVRVARAPSRGALVAGALGAAALFGVWAWTRGVGVPFSAAGRAPVGVLDALTAFDELLLAGFALAAAARGRAALPRAGWQVLGFAAISLSFMALAMGCEPSQSAEAATAGASHTRPLICHLY